MKKTIRIFSASLVSRFVRTKRGSALLLFASIFSTLTGCTARAGEILLSQQTHVIFANASQGREVLGKKDDFVAALSPFDRVARVKSDEPVSEDQFIKFVQANVLEWDAEEETRVTAAVKSVAVLLKRWPLGFPSKILLIKTTGREEGSAAYTRQNAIILPAGKLKSRQAGLEDLLLHELFHVLSRHNEKLRADLYRIVGFHHINEIIYPAELRARRITNPDGVQTGWAMSVTNQNGKVSIIPVLFSSTDRYDTSKGGEFFSYLQFKLLVLEQSAGRWQPALLEGKPQLLEPSAEPGYLDQVGRNTDYINHPDEVLASNFVLLVRNKENLPTPRVLAEMDGVLRNSGQ